MENGAPTMNDTEIELHGATVTTEDVAIITIDNETESYRIKDVAGILHRLDVDSTRGKVLRHYNKSHEELLEIFGHALKMLGGFK